jgi:deazaflavin-dependent oxidoreductase (nitroreductase family)
MSGAPGRHGVGVPTRLEHVLDSRSVAVAAWLYRRTGGRIVRPLRRRVLVLTTMGPRSGRPRTVVVQYFPDGDDFVVVGANSGMPTDPAWCRNLRVNPRARIEVGRRSGLGCSRRRRTTRASPPEPTGRSP